MQAQASLQRQVSVALAFSVASASTFKLDVKISELAFIARRAQCVERRSMPCCLVYSGLYDTIRYDTTYNPAAVCKKLSEPTRLAREMVVNCTIDRHPLPCRHPYRHAQQNRYNRRL